MPFCSPTLNHIYLDRLFRVAYILYCFWPALNSFDRLYRLVKPFEVLWHFSYWITLLEVFWTVFSYFVTHWAEIYRSWSLTVKLSCLQDVESAFLRMKEVCEIVLHFFNFSLFHMQSLHCKRYQIMYISEFVLIVEYQIDNFCLYSHYVSRNSNKISFSTIRSMWHYILENNGSVATLIEMV